MTRTRFVVAAIALLAMMAPVAADAGQDVIASGVVAATSIESGIKPAGAVAVGFGVNRLASVGVEVTVVPTLKPDGDARDRVALAAPVGMTSAASGGRATIFTTNVRVEIPAVGTRIIPYVIGGGGVANVKEDFTIGLAGSGASATQVVNPRASLTESSTALALTAGGGVSVVIAQHLSLDADARYVRLISGRDLNVRRFGVGLSYRF
jgi:opacity protein-like surface antigen